MNMMLRVALVSGLISLAMQGGAMQVVALNQQGSVVSSQDKNLQTHRSSFLGASSGAWLLGNYSGSDSSVHTKFLFFNGLSWGNTATIISGPEAGAIAKADQSWSACGFGSGAGACGQDSEEGKNAVMLALPKTGKASDFIAVVHGDQSSQWFPVPNGKENDVNLSLTCGGGQCFILHRYLLSDGSQDDSVPQISVSPINFNALTQNPLASDNKININNKRGKNYKYVVQGQPYWYPFQLNPHSRPLFYHDSAGQFYGMFSRAAAKADQSRVYKFDLDGLKFSSENKLSLDYLQSFKSLLSVRFRKQDAPTPVYFTRMLVAFWHSKHTFFVLTTKSFVKQDPESAEQVLHYSTDDGHTWHDYDCKGFCPIFPSSSNTFITNFSQDGRLVSFDSEHPSNGVTVFDPSTSDPKFFKLPALPKNKKIEELKTAVGSQGDFWVVTNKNRVYHFNYVEKRWKRVKLKVKGSVRLEALANDRAIILINQPGVWPSITNKAYFQFYNGSALSGPASLPDSLNECYDFSTDDPELHYSNSSNVYGNGPGGMVYLTNTLTNCLDN